MKQRHTSVRIPGPPPAWRDPRLVGGILLITLSITVFTLLLARARAGELIFQTTRPIAQGEVLNEENTTIVEVRPGSNAYVREGTLKTGAIAKHSLGKGELLARSSVTTQHNEDHRRIVITVIDGLPASVNTGQQLELWSIPGSTYHGPPSDDGEAQPQRVASHVTLVGRVEDGSRMPSQAGTRIDIAVAKADISQVLRAMAGNGNLAAVPVGS
ncbi:hypothetical protein G7Y41_06640 [Schaalia sp. ZJ405]|uniref:SAF domain-containing protein n=1 Tax=Schaalia sp. ZJ405 TaxID=2709403 RepID=UPI0013EBAC07|nr:SAF domain-containing protein [Schaalia sp. ZJ405]QPK80741.1 hypothetical protein G7Y41_06640 [Schaalia sp. ZJ405]